jgi:hypothetical protein
MRDVALRGFSAMHHAAVLDEGEGVDAVGNVCCYVIPLNGGTCKDSHVIHDFDLRAALAVAAVSAADASEESTTKGRSTTSAAGTGGWRFPSAGSVTTVPLVPRMGDVGDNDDDKAERMSVLSLLKMAATADVVYIDVGDVKEEWLAELERAADAAARGAMGEAASRVKGFQTACFRDV